MAFTLAGGHVIYPDPDALATVCHYAFATELLQPRPGFPEAFPAQVVPRYAYRTYDCIPAWPGPDFTDLDLLVTAGLNAGITVSVLVRLRSFADRAAGLLDTAYQMQPDFRSLRRDQVGTSPPQGSAGWHLCKAWEQGMATPELGVARVHKTMHHKRPCLFPLLDNETITLLDPAAQSTNSSKWQVIWDDLHVNWAQFEWLEDEFNQRAHAAGTARLSWLRLYDILLWMWSQAGGALPALVPAP